MKVFNMLETSGQVETVAYLCSHLAHARVPSQAGPHSLTVKSDVGEPLEQGNAPAQLFCLTAA